MDTDTEGSGDELTLAEREQAVTAREERLGEREELFRAREELLRLREEAMQARTEAEQARIERERLLVQMREINEQLLIATVRADEVAEQATAARATIAAHAAALQAQDRAKDEFLAMLGHELRNPLTPILGMLDVMELRSPDVLAGERGVIAGQVRQLVRLVDDLLDLSRVTEGKVELRLERIDLGNVIARSVESVAPFVERKQLALNVEVTADEPLVVDGDFVRLTQAIGNLLTNAAKYTPDGGTITLTAARRGATIVISVRDTGIGISEEMLPRVFDLFAQEARALDRSAGGLGLGLTIAQRLVHMHGGSITARSEGEGHGSEFELVLPASNGRSVRDRRNTERVPSAPLGLKVLLVDDNRLAAEAIQILIEMLGYEVRTAADGAEALGVATEYAPDIAVLDIGLPGIDGYQVAQRLRELSSRTRLVAVTGYGRDADRERSAEVGFDEHLVKPVDFETIKGCLSRVSRRIGELP